MGNAFAAVGRALPARRDELITAGVTAALADRPAGRLGFADSIVVPEARDRLLEIFDRVQRPGEVASTLEGALQGDLWRQQMLFQAMIDTWPRLQKALREVKLAARNAPWQVMPWCARGEKPAAPAEKLAKEVENIIWAMRPDPIRGHKGFEGTVEELAMGYFLGHHVLEPQWQRGKDGAFTVTSAKPVPPRFYGYPATETGEDRLMLDKNGGQNSGWNFEDFPPHRFLIAVNGGHTGHPSQAAPLRVLTGYWLAAVYGLKWVMNYAQLFGIPFRWATYPVGDAKAKAEVAAMMANIGSAGWAAFPAGTSVEFMESSKSGSSLAQAELLKIADEQCDIFILGQTLTSSAGDKGSQSLGTVHMEVRQEMLAGVCDFVGEILTHQLSAAIVAVNHGPERTDIPGIWAKFEQARDEKAMAERDAALGILDGSLPVGKEWLYERHAVPMPVQGEELFKEKQNPAPPAAPAPGEDPPGEEMAEVIAASLAECALKVGRRIAAADEPAAAVGARLRALITAGGFRTLDDGRVIYLDRPRSESRRDSSASAYRRDAPEWKKREATADREAANEKARETEPTRAELDALAEEEAAEVIDLEEARKEYEAEMLEEAMAGFPEISKTIRGRLPRPDDLPEGESMRGEIQGIWDSFKKETRARKKNGQRVIQPGGAPAFFASKGNGEPLDKLRESLNERGFQFDTPADMLQAVLDSLEGRKSWGTHRQNIAAGAAMPATSAGLLQRMEEAAAAGITDPDTAAAALAVAWLKGAGEADPDKVAAAYNPNQARDPGGPGGGRWIKTGTTEAQDIDEFIRLAEATPEAIEVERRLAEIEAATRSGDVTTWSQELHTDAEGNYTPQRQALHAEIAAKVLNPLAVAAPGESPEVHLLLGRGGSGKSTVGLPIITKSGKQFTTLNPDEIKEALPEYEGWNAAAVHEESSHVAKNSIMRAALQGRHNLILDETGANPEKMERRIRAMADLGYKVNLVYVDVPTKTSVERAWGRFMGNPLNRDPNKTPGRYVPLSIVKDVGDGPSRSYEALKKIDGVKTWVALDNSVPKGSPAKTLDQGSRP